ncbi:MAG: hypothetical protein HY898_23025 [Deltaproteobacteria bacterium]|nr:hypothetical protein [Deltaproteobacteria bacterium]
MGNAALVSMGMVFASSAALAQTAASPVASAQTMPASPAPTFGSGPPTKTAPATLPYDGGEVPWGYRIESRPLYELMIAGGAVLVGGVVLVSYAAVKTSQVSCDFRDGESCDSEKNRYLVHGLIGSGLILTGLVVGFVGLAIRNEKLVRDPSVPAISGRPSRRFEDSVSIGTVGVSGLGLTMSARF